MSQENTCRKLSGRKTHARYRFLEKGFLTPVYVFPYIYIHNSFMHTDIRNTKVSKAHIDRDYLGSSTDSFEINLYVHLFHLFSFIPINCCVFFLNNNKTTGFFFQNNFECWFVPHYLLLFTMFGFQVSSAVYFAILMNPLTFSA